MFHELVWRENNNKIKQNLQKDEGVVTMATVSSGINQFGVYYGRGGVWAVARYRPLYLASPGLSCVRDRVEGSTHHAASGLPLLLHPDSVDI